MRLYMHQAACSLSPHIVCRELGLPVELVEVDRKTKTTAGGEDFRPINPNGYVPVLGLDTGGCLTEGPAIVQFLAELRPESGMLPPERTVERAEVRSLLNFITSEVHKPMGMLFQTDFQASHAAIRAMVDKRLDWINGRLAGPYLTGPAFTVADAYLFVCLNWSPWIGIDLASRPALTAFMAKVGGRPAVQEALRAEALLPHGPDGMFHAPSWAIEAAKAAQR